MKILLVEDETKIRKGIRSIVEDVVKANLHIAEAANGKEALDWLRTQEKVDLVISDIRMGEMNGIELLKRTRELHPDISFIIISGYDEFAYARDAIRYGALDYLLKPIDRVELARVLNRVREMVSRVGVEHGSVVQEAHDEKERLLIRRVKELVNEFLDQDISLQFLAERVYLHPKYVSEIFKRETGRNLSDYVTELRMDKAKKLLKETTLKIAEISAMCGYANHKYFASLFKHHTGKTPKEFRDF